MQPTFRSIRLGIGLLMLTSPLLGLPLGIFRANRVVAGQPLDIRTILAFDHPVIVVVLIIALLIVASISRQLRELVLRLLPWLLIVMPGLVLIRLSSSILPGSSPDDAIARISLSSGFWLFFAGILLLQSTDRLATWIYSLTGVFTLLVVVLGGSPQLGLYREYLNVQDMFFAEFQRHLMLALSSVLFAIIPGLVLGYWCHRNSRAREWIIGAVNFFQVAPTLSLLGLIMIPLTILSRQVPLVAALGIKGIGFAPAFIVLTLYCLLPITANAFAGFDQVDDAVVDSAIALGLTRHQVFRSVLFPLALPVIFSGIRTAVTQNISNTILAGLIGGGGLGALIFLGLSQSASDLVLLGTIPVVVLALVADVVFKWIEERLTRRAGVYIDSNQASL